MRRQAVTIVSVAVAGIIALPVLSGCATGSAGNGPAGAPAPQASARTRSTSTHVTLPSVAPPSIVGGSTPSSGTRSAPAPAPAASSSTFETAVATARREQKLAVIDFGATWCGPCKTMQRTTWADPTLVAWLSRNATRAHVDIEQRTDLSRRYDIGAVPTTIVLRDGQEVGRFTGSRGAADVQAWLQGFAGPTPAAPAPAVRAASNARPAPTSSITRMTVTK